VRAERPRLTLFRLLAAVACLAVSLAVVREDFWLGVSVACVGSMTLLRTCVVLDLCDAQGVTLRRGQRARLAASSALVALAIVGTSDLAFLMAYVFVEVGRSGGRHSYMTPDWDPWSALVALALSVAVAWGMKVWLWPCRLVSDPAPEPVRAGPGSECIREASCERPGPG